MSPLIAKILRRLAEPSSGGALDDALRKAAFVFEKGRGLEPSGWDQDVLDANVTEMDLAQLKAAMVQFVERRGLGSFALGKCHDPSLKPVFVGVLRRHVDGDGAELYQAMIALEDVGENVFGGRQSSSVLDEAENRVLARKYLESR